MFVKLNTSRVATPMGLAFVNAAARDGLTTWMAKQVAHSVEHTKAGTKPVADTVHISDIGVGDRRYSKMCGN